MGGKVRGRSEKSSQGTEGSNDDRYAAETNHGAPIAQNSIVSSANDGGGRQVARGGRGGRSGVLGIGTKGKG